jgi:hypothetical protein
MSHFPTSGRGALLVATVRLLHHASVTGAVGQAAGSTKVSTQFRTAT